MKIAWNIWTYKNDSIPTPICVRSILKVIPHHVSKIFIWDDESNPLTRESVDKLRELGCCINKTRFDRHGNLRGISNLRGMAGCYMESVKKSGCDYIAKIDPDILIVNNNLESFLDKPAVFSMCGKTNPYGNVYIMHKKIASFFNEDANKEDPFFEHKEYWKYVRLPFPEDKMFFLYSLIYFGEENVRQFFQNDFWSFWTYNRDAKRLLKNNFKNNFCVNFGTRFLDLTSKEGETKEQQRNRMAKEMERVLKFL